MTEEINFETYLNISPSKFGIYLFDKKKLINLYEKEIKLENNSDKIEFGYLNRFLEENIFKIEKLIGKFIKNICVIISDYKISNLKFSIKKKNYHKTINQDFLKELVIDAKELFNENYQNQKVLHILINRYIINGESHFIFKENSIGDLFCIEIEFKYVDKEFINEVDKVLSGYQIKTLKYFDGKYLNDFFKADEVVLPKIFSKIQSGFNDNEVEIVVKNRKKSGFFEKFFQLFS